MPKTIEEEIQELLKGTTTQETGGVVTKETESEDDVREETATEDADEEHAEEDEEGTQEEVAAETDRESLLLREIQRLSGELLTLQQQVMGTKETPVVEDPIPTFIQTDAELDESFKNAQGVNALLQKVFAQAVEQAKKLLVEQQKTYATIAASETQRQLTTQEQIRDFYDEHRDLRGYKQLVAYVAQGLSKEEKFKEARLIDVLNAAAVEVRKMVPQATGKKERAKPTRRGAEDAGLVRPRSSSGLRETQKRELSPEEEIYQLFQPGMGRRV